MARLKVMRLMLFFMPRTHCPASVLDFISRQVKKSLEAALPVDHLALARWSKAHV